MRLRANAPELLPTAFLLAQHRLAIPCSTALCATFPRVARCCCSVIHLAFRVISTIRPSHDRMVCTVRWRDEKALGVSFDTYCRAGRRVLAIWQGPDTKA